MTNVERVERDIAREKMFREAFINGKEPTDEDKAAWALADAHNQMSLACNPKHLHTNCVLLQQMTVIPVFSDIP